MIRTARAGAKPDMTAEPNLWDGKVFISINPNFILHLDISGVQRLDPRPFRSQDGRARAWGSSIEKVRIRSAASPCPVLGTRSPGCMILD